MSMSGPSEPRRLNDQQSSSDRARMILTVFVVIVLLVTTFSYINKARKGRSAILRWQPQILEMRSGVDLYDEYEYPNTPIVAMLLYPIVSLPPMPAALVFFVLKVVMAYAAVKWSIDLACGHSRAPPVWAVAVLLVLAARPIISDLQHGNINILILFLVMAGLKLFSIARPLSGGMLIGLATVAKVTPALFIPYFLWKRRWRMVVGCALGGVLSILLPTLVLGWSQNLEMHRAWYEQMIEPFITETGTEYSVHINQSLPGMVVRFFTDSPAVDLHEDAAVADPDATISYTLVALSPTALEWVLRGLLLTVLGWLFWMTRGRLDQKHTRTWAIEFGLVLLAMLILSERTWKHHFVIATLPLAVVVCTLALNSISTRMRTGLWAAVAGFFLLTSLTSGELIGWMYKGEAHKFVEAAGSFFWAALILFITLSALRHVQRKRTTT